MRAHRLITALILLMSISCRGHETVETIHLSWRFVDGRECDLAGVVDVVVDDGDDTSPLRTTFRCPDGLAPDRFQVVTVPTRPVTLTLEGRSITGALLYRGETSLDEDSPQPQQVTLRFEGGESP